MSVNDLPIQPRHEVENDPCFTCTLSDCHPMSINCPKFQKEFQPEKRWRHNDWESFPKEDLAWLKKRSTYYKTNHQIVINATKEELEAHGVYNKPRLQGRTYRLALSSRTLCRLMGYEK